MPKKAKPTTEVASVETMHTGELMPKVDDAKESLDLVNLHGFTLNETVSQIEAELTSEAVKERLGYLRQGELLRLLRYKSGPAEFMERLSFLGYSYQKASALMTFSRQLGGRENIANTLGMSKWQEVRRMISAEELESNPDTLDQFSKMTVLQLRELARENATKLAAKDRVIEDKDKQLRAWFGDDSQRVFDALVLQASKTLQQLAKLVSKVEGDPAFWRTVSDGHRRLTSDLNDVYVNANLDDQQDA